MLTCCNHGHCIHDALFIYFFHLYYFLFLLFYKFNIFHSCVLCISFLLKAIEKLVDRHIKETVVNVYPLSDSQHAYQSGRSTDTALYCLSSILEKTLSHKETALAVFLDIEGAFDRVPIPTILRALKRRNIDDTIISWIECFLSCRYNNASLGGDDLTIHTNAGCLQGGVLSPILWCLVVDLLLEDLKFLSLFCIGCANDVIIMV